MSDPSSDFQRGGPEPQNYGRYPGDRYPPKKSLYAKMSGWVESHSGMALAIIIVLVLIIVGYYVYTKWMSPKKGGGAKKKAAPAEYDQGDPETEEMIAAINNT